MKYYLIAGEASGDLHGSNLMKAIEKQDPNANFRFWGGDLMEAVGGTQVMHYKERSFMGFLEVITNIGTALNNIKHCKKDIEAFNPDALIFIDYSGFNLRIAKWAKPNGYSTHYYITPQVWASREKRVQDIKRDIDHMYVILPFVKDFYQNKHQMDVDFVGHPLIDAIENRDSFNADEFKRNYQLDDRPIIALLPGSRKQEIKKMLSVMLSMIPHFNEYQFVIGGAPSQEEAFYKSIIKYADVAFVPNKTYDLLSVARAALVTSGTATLETALFKVPQVVCYKGSWLSYQIAKRIITLKYISLVNLIVDKPLVTELIQGDLNSKRLRNELNHILQETNRIEILNEYDLLIEELGGGGASAKAAALIIKNIDKSK
ncbi:lipid-A-disaccharide synthase [Spongiivirga citrea]|uniref:Lipid-A-disaccharide synthase n=1 Tax=Spongiivirga citrea TaxID=1481457 RepID=A0A6M0CQS1_9FLAO|nr:lipid-A-disaccharide synthase [Spongiivirga citrea]NER18219.1 lipid-A-disaccharide synthase [Spongiivirga citrea]